MEENIIIKTLLEYLFWFPITMSIVWTVTSLYFYFRRESKKKSKMVELENPPLVSIIIPCFNEEAVIEGTVKSVMELNYPNFEIILVNDGSLDNTFELLKELVLKYESLRVINLKTNRGKANALYLATIASKGEYILGVDADAHIHKDALNYMIPHFVTKRSGERVGAVTGNPKINNRTTLLSKIQLVEYSSIIGMIKRAQRILGKVMTVSGVLVAYRKRALLEVGFWDRDIITEDIAVTWKLQRGKWDIRYEPRAICYMYVPEKLKGLWKQRVRWAQGALETMIVNTNMLLDFTDRRFWSVYIEQIFSIFWAFDLIFLVIYFIFVNPTRSIKMIFDFSLVTIVCLFQFGVSVLIEYKYDKDILKNYIWAVWYPILYWILNALFISRACFKVIGFKRGKYATWTSPDRGNINEKS